MLFFLSPSKRVKSTDYSILKALKTYMKEIIKIKGIQIIK